MSSDAAQQSGPRYQDDASEKDRRGDLDSALESCNRTLVLNPMLGDAEGGAADRRKAVELESGLTRLS